MSWLERLVNSLNNGLTVEQWAEMESKVLEAIKDCQPEKRPEYAVRATFWTLRDLFPWCEVRLEEKSRGCCMVSHEGKHVSFHESWWPLDAAQLYQQNYELGLRPTPAEFRKQLEVVDRVAKERPMP